MRDKKKEIIEYLKDYKIAIDVEEKIICYRDTSIRGWFSLKRNHVIYWRVTDIPTSIIEKIIGRPKKIN